MVDPGASRTARVDAASLGSDYGMVHIEAFPGYRDQ